MHSSDYITRICRELASRPSYQAEAETKALIGIFEQVEALPSPTREEKFVDLLLGLEPQVEPQFANAPQDRSLAA